MDQFSDIRPYLDHEVRPILDRLLTNREFIDSIARFNAPRLFRVLPWLVRVLARSRLTAQLKDVSSVASMQDIIAEYMERMINTTTDGLTHSGIESLSRDKRYLFISNHRDIAMDPAFVNYVLYHNGFDTLQIAIGDNLLKKPFVTDLMRLNKSFIVRRSLKGRELLRALDHMSAYIHHCVNHGQNVWIAQREGRAKDGVDRTDPALIKMLSRGNKALSLGESIRSLHVVPVAISYEYDGCDLLKAEELFQVETAGRFTKDDASDIHSIVTGITGRKGRVHVAFGRELDDQIGDDPERIAGLIDVQIATMYRLRDSNFLALAMLRDGAYGALPELDQAAFNHETSAQCRATFEARINAADPHLRKYLLWMYANPVITRYRTQV